MTLDATDNVPRTGPLETKWPERQDAWVHLFLGLAFVCSSRRALASLAALLLG